MSTTPAMYATTTEIVEIQEQPRMGNNLVVPSQQQAYSSATGQYDNQRYATKPGQDVGFGGHGHGHGHGHFPSTTITLQPIATPQALGLAAWACATFVFSTYIAEWYGNTGTAQTLWPFILTFGGIGQFAAGMWSFRARDTLNSVIHTLWGGYWLALGLYFIGTASNVSTQPVSIWSRLEAFAIWHVPIAAFTWSACVASLFRDLGLTAILFTMATGSTLSVIGWFAASEAVLKVAAYFWLFSSLGMLYRVTGHFLHETTKRDTLLPLYNRGGLGRKGQNQEEYNHGWREPYREAGVVQGSEW